MRCVCVCRIQRCPNLGSWEAEEPSQGQGHQFFAKLVWHLFFFFWFMEMTACNVLACNCRWLVAILSVVVFPSKRQRSLHSCKEDFSTFSKSSVLWSYRKRTISKTVLLGSNSFFEFGSKIYLCMLTFSDSNSVKKIIFRTLPIPIRVPAKR